MSAEQLTSVASRVVDRLRSMPLAQLARGAADDAHAVAQRLADLAADAEGQERRTLPRIGDEAVGDQVAVTVADLIEAAPSDEVLAEATEALRDLQRRL
jgi:uncharacterized membrane-anchored protein